MQFEKIIIIGQKHLTHKDLCFLDSDRYQITSLPANHSIEKSDFDENTRLIFINYDAQKEMSGLSKIYQMRKFLPDVPIILIALEKEISVGQIVQATREGMTDCLIPPFGESELDAVINTYLKNDSGFRNRFPSVLSLFMPSQKEGFVSSAFPFSPPLSKNEVETDLYTHFFGTFRMTTHGKTIKNPAGLRVKSLLAYLLFHAPICINREKLQRRFWQDFSEESARNNLNVNITHLRRHFQNYLKEEVIVFQDDCFSINPDLYRCSDISDFLEAYESGKTQARSGDKESAFTFYKKAIQSYKSDFLEDMWREEWTLPIREELQEKYIKAHYFTSSHYVEKGDYEHAIESLRHILSKDDCWEEAHRKLMECYIEIGKTDRAVRQFKECERILKAKLNTNPSKSTVDVFKRLMGAMQSN